MTRPSPTDTAELSLGPPTYVPRLGQQVTTHIGSHLSGSALEVPKRSPKCGRLDEQGIPGNACEAALGINPIAPQFATPAHYLVKDD
jgi:hypothetical protein